MDSRKKSISIHMAGADPQATGEHPKKPFLTVSASNPLTCLTYLQM